MDDDSKKILILRIVVGFLVFVAIMIFIIIVLAIKNGNKRAEDLETTTRRTLSGEVETSSSSSSSESTSVSSSSSTSTSSTTQAPQTQAPTQGTTKSGGGSSGGGSSSGGGGSSNTLPTDDIKPAHNFTVITSGNATNYKDANNTIEWEVVNKINNARNKKLKVAAELRTAAERLAETCCNGGIGFCAQDTSTLFDTMDYDQFVAYIDSTKYTKDYSSNDAFNTISSKYKSLVIDNNNYNYMGVGVIQKGQLKNCIAVVVNE